MHHQTPFAFNKGQGRTCGNPIRWRGLRGCVCGGRMKCYAFFVKTIQTTQEGNSRSNEANISAMPFLMIHYSFPVIHIFFKIQHFLSTKNDIYEKIAYLKCLLFTWLRWRCFIILVQEFGSCIQNKNDCSDKYTFTKKNIEKYPFLQKQQFRNISYNRNISLTYRLNIRLDFNKHFM